ncbi:hypothetical protein [Lysinibacillus sp. NPDC093688]|uniref:hypothetical protein n=1 Tax=Lysinibacillus sp. NPDC093688 TaxID=3390577 RepID=UPI003D0055AD
MLTILQIVFSIIVVSLSTYGIITSDYSLNFLLIFILGLLISHAEGVGTESSGYNSHAEGMNTNALGSSSHAEGMDTKASANFSHAEGVRTEASGYASHAEGPYTNASGYASHAEGWYTNAEGYCSHAQNRETIANNYASTAIGKFNKKLKGESSSAVQNSDEFVIGNGIADLIRSNAFNSGRHYLF